MEDENEAMRMHSAGATVRHNSPFHHLPVHKNVQEISVDFIQLWAVPYYLKIGSRIDSEWPALINDVKAEITKDICLSLLGDFNWRTRFVGAYFAAVKGYTELIDIIGVHLLKSEVCCVGHMYALVLAYFNKEQSVYYLNTYLDYYLTKPELEFDQEVALQALLYMDQVNNTAYAASHNTKWNIWQQERRKLSRQQVIEIAKTLKDSGEHQRARSLLDSMNANNNIALRNLSTRYFEEQVRILGELTQ